MGSHAAPRLNGQLSPGGAWAFWGILAELFLVLLAQELHSGFPEEGEAAGQSSPGGDPIMCTFPSLKPLVENLSFWIRRPKPYRLPCQPSGKQGGSPAFVKAKPLPFPAPDALPLSLPQLWSLQSFWPSW